MKVDSLVNSSVKRVHFPFDFNSVVSWWQAKASLVIIAKHYISWQWLNQPKETTCVSRIQ